MPVTRRATENNNTIWLPLPAIPLTTFVLAKPDLRFVVTDAYSRWQVDFGLGLHPDERAQYLPKRDLPPNTQQSDRVFHSPGLSFGFIRDGAYQTTKLVDFMSACFGLEGGEKFREWIEDGGGSPRPLDRDDDKAEIEMIKDWFGWMEGLMVYGSIRHELDRRGTGRMFARFGGPLPLGSIKGQPEDAYQVLALGKYRAMRAETERADEAFEEAKAKRAKLPEAQPPQRWDATGRTVEGEGGDGVDMEEMPF